MLFHEKYGRSLIKRIQYYPTYKILKLENHDKSNIIFTSLLRHTISWYHCKSTWYKGFANFRNSGFHRSLVLKKLSLCLWYLEGHRNLVWVFLKSKSFVLSSYVCRQHVISLPWNKEEVCEKTSGKNVFLYGQFNLGNLPLVYGNSLQNKGKLCLFTTSVQAIKIKDNSEVWRNSKKKKKCGALNQKCHLRLMYLNILPQFLVMLGKVIEHWTSVLLEEVYYRKLALSVLTNCSCSLCVHPSYILCASFRFSHCTTCSLCTSFLFSLHMS